MQLSNNTKIQIDYSGGGRIASPAYRSTLAMAEDFCGLEEGTDRYALLLLVKKVGKLAGFSPRMIHLLDYYLAFTRDGDWEEGSRPIVYQSLSRTALDLGVSERQVQKLEKALFDAGAISWNDSGNHRRFGQRCAETGRILWAYGVELTPLAYLREELEAKLAEKRLYDEAWLDTKRRISACRRQLRAHLAEWAANEGGEEGDRVAEFAQRYDEIAVQLRTHLDLAAMRSFFSRHESLLSELVAAMGAEQARDVLSTQRASLSQESAKGSCPSEPAFAHYKSTNQPSKDSGSRADEGLQESVAEGPVVEDVVSCSGLTHVTLAMAAGAASDRMRARLPHDAEWKDLVEAAYQLRTELGISQTSWADACQLLGRTGAAVCLLVTDRAALREVDPARSPAAYFRGMVNRARRGELRLHRSVFGLLERGGTSGVRHACHADGFVARIADDPLAPLLDLPAALRSWRDLRRLHVKPAAAARSAQLAREPGLDAREEVATACRRVLLRSPECLAGREAAEAVAVVSAGLVGEGPRTFGAALSPAGRGEPTRPLGLVVPVGFGPGDERRGSDREGVPADAAADPGG